MENNIIGKFYAITFKDDVYEFIVNDNYTITCLTIGLDSINKIYIKPRFELYCNNYKYINPAKSGVRDGLIKNFIIDDNILKFLKNNNMIIYSTDMAYLYGFNDKDGYDNNKYGVHTPYKWAKKKGSILVKQRNGQYN